MSTLTLRPNAASLTAQTRSAGTNNYECIDEVTLSETDYCYASGSSVSNTLLDLYAFPDHSTETETINSVTIKGYAKKIVTGTDANNVTFRTTIDISGTRYYGSGNNLTTSTALYSHVYSVNPATSSAWTWTNIDNLLAGDEMTSNRIDKNNYASSYCYQLWVEVDYGEAAGPVIPVFMYHYMHH
jgi:hypothetical protein